MSPKDKILIVGDLHGEWGKLNTLINNKKPSIVLQCGDFGWWPAMETLSKLPIQYGERRKPWELKGLKTGGPSKTKVYFCDGNHEEHTQLQQDGTIREMYPNVYHGTRGSTLTLPDGRVVLFVGGAASIDRGHRTEGVDWFPDEVLMERDMEMILSHSRADIVISHTCPTTFLPYLPMKKRLWGKGSDPSCLLLQQVLDKYQPSLWFFGHWHYYGQGIERGCKWTCLDYPSHIGRWWTWL